MLRDASSASSHVANPFGPSSLVNSPVVGSQCTAQAIQAARQRLRQRTALAYMVSERHYSFAAFAGGRLRIQM